MATASLGGGSCRDVVGIGGARHHAHHSCIAVCGIMRRDDFQLPIPPRLERPRTPVRMRAFTGMRSLFAWTKPRGYVPLCRQRRSGQRGLFSTTNVGGTSTPIHRRDAGNIGRRDGRSLRDTSDTQSYPAWQPDNRSLRKSCRANWLKTDVRRVTKMRPAIAGWQPQAIPHRANRTMTRDSLILQAGLVAEEHSTPTCRLWQ